MKDIEIHFFIRMGLRNKTFIFRKNVIKPYERALQVDHETQSLRSQKLTLDF